MIINTFWGMPNSANWAEPWFDFCSFGMARRWRQELEHLAVEANELAAQTLENAANAATHARSEYELHQQLEHQISEAGNNLLALITQTTLNLWLLPITRYHTQPPRKRFPITLDGSYEVIDP